MLAKAIPFRLVGAIVLFEAIVTTALPVRERLIAGTTDGSMAQRLKVWKGAASCIYDHPMGVGLHDMMKILENWYFNGEFQDRFSSCLNDFVTAAVAWGLIPLTIIIILLCWTIGIAFNRTRSGCLWATLGLAMLITVSVSSQFQAHTFAKYNWGRMGYTLGFLLVLYSLIDAHCKGYNKKNVILFSRSSIYCTLGGFSTIIILLTMMIFNSNSTWSTQITGGFWLVRPRKTIPSAWIGVAGIEQVPKENLQTWLCAIEKENIGILLIRDSLPTIPSIEPIFILANGDTSSYIWPAWWRGSFNVCPVILTDPTNIELPAGQCKGAEITLKIALGAPMINREAINSCKNKLPQVIVEDVKGWSAAWWRDVSLDYYLRSRTNVNKLPSPIIR